MNDLQSTLAALAAVEGGETNSNAVLVGGDPDFKVGKYGIRRRRWKELSDAFGYSGADWRDETAQDRIAAEVLTRAYRELGDWERAAVAFRFGMPIARAVETPEPVEFDNWGHPEISKYVRQLRRSEPYDGPMVGRGGTRPTPRTQPRRRRAEDVVRNQLYAMRNAQRAGASDANEGGDDELAVDG